ncbi:HAD family hydrolase [Leptolyngbya sp. FACHB-261]|uniref:HAD family hydrolase n=1 Tax=Leptolyngbya sp. FACHB-261 TaxID=2692806 RepID=UPI0016835B7D|nr:HAD family hydrolase [Leptolyngbya sp. FACHB-261]MBD2103784.1 HAD family hydrolase [Leptolyngbya sp. FACHB-261]
MVSPSVLALDFDGVLCDGLREYFQTAWRVYQQVWQSSPEPPLGLEAAFSRLRPVVETGWEMPVLLRAVLLGIPETEILSGDHWRTQAQDAPEATPTHLAAALDQVRDQWIRQDLASWLGLQRFYPGVVQRLHSLLDCGLPVVIITTKEGRFTQQLLQQQGIQLPHHQVIGKEYNQPKTQSLRAVQQTYEIPADEIWFVEDRLKTLQTVQHQPDLQGLHLFLAEWGYTTSENRNLARRDPQLVSLSLARFCQDFAAWREH